MTTLFKNQKQMYKILVLVSLFLVIIFSLRFYNQFKVWNDHRDFLNSNNASIEEWMTINLVLNHFTINKYELFNELNISDNWNNRRKTLVQIFEEQKLDRTIELSKLNKLIK